MSFRRCQLRFYQASSKPMSMFCLKDGRKYFDKSFKLLLRYSMTDETVAMIMNCTRNWKIEDLTESSGETLLHQAAKYGVIKLAKYLVSNGCEVDAQSPDCGWTPLMMAACYGHTDVCKLLLSYNADIFATNCFGESVLYIATTWIPDDPYDFRHLNLFSNKLMHLGLDKEQLATMLMKANSPIYYIIQLNDANVTRILRERRYNPPKACNDTMLLHEALALKNLENVKFIFESMDLDVNWLDEQEYAPLHYAVENGDDKGNVSIIKYLLDKGADINIRGVDGMTPLFSVFCACMTNQQKKYCIYFLLQQGADPQIFDSNDDTVIDYAMDIEDADDTLLDPVISHLALREALGFSMNEKIREQIEEQEGLKQFYDSCKQCLETMKKIILSGDISMYKLLTESDEKLMEYLCNVEVSRNYVHTVFNLNSYYRYVVNKRFVQIMTRLKRKK